MIMGKDTSGESIPPAEQTPRGPVGQRALDLAPAAAAVARAGQGRDACIQLLQELQAAYGYLPAAALQYVTEHTAISWRQLYGVATFYEQFRFAPAGRHLIRVCHGTACHVNGARSISRAVEEALRIANRETTPDGLFTLETVACLGCCSLAPVMMIDATTYGRLTPDAVRKILHDYQKVNV